MPDSVPRVPPATVISDWIKSEVASLSVKVMVAVSPDFKPEVEEAIVIVGGTVSTWIVN